MKSQVSQVSFEEYPDLAPESRFLFGGHWCRMVQRVRVFQREDGHRWVATSQYRERICSHSSCTDVGCPDLLGGLALMFGEEALDGALAARDSRALARLPKRST